MNIISIVKDPLRVYSPKLLGLRRRLTRNQNKFIFTITSKEDSQHYSWFLSLSFDSIRSPRVVHRPYENNNRETPGVLRERGLLDSQLLRIICRVFHLRTNIHTHKHRIFRISVKECIKLVIKILLFTRSFLIPGEIFFFSISVFYPRMGFFVVDYRN